MYDLDDVKADEAQFNYEMARHTQNRTESCSDNCIYCITHAELLHDLNEEIPDSAEVLIGTFAEGDKIIF